ncbi:MICAL-like protein 1 isoform X2 [Anthonomus grandis grandis]|uniref:MICAL-like protein 1 isoform X2 n=1 Tax=Anthonomus grandis grandis TaxID=2921223 RepID=UPI0021654FAF|nr:MICAL-like protein 1 isoform X2 [Anthonomus grandis grandis]
MDSNSEITMSRGTKALELWCRKKTEGYPGVKVENMTTSWRDGLAFCAIIHHFRPDLIEFDKLNKDEIYNNNELAFRVAEDYLGIPALLEPADMVQYEVPDRLSILTYLSQFYQTFENQRGKTGARTAPKRPQSTADHGIVSPASTSPPTKVHIPIGRPRREPCAKCNLPVFIAERLNVGKLLYHRTCFKCARCNSQLTLANYYETENGEFVCELCPDEEKPITNTKKLTPETVLTRSLSDEEKTASLRTYETSASNRFETALEAGFTYADSSEFSMARSQFFQSQMEDYPTKPPQTSSDNSSFPSVKSDTDKFSDSSEQTRNRIVTKDDTSPIPRPGSVRARMKLFENNEDNKSDVNSSAKKAKVVAIDDLEDFDNISRQSVDVSSRKDIFIETSFVGDSSIKVHSENSVIEISDGSVEAINHSVKQSNLDDSCIIIEDSLESSNNKDSLNKADDSLFSVPDSVSSEDPVTANRDYCTTYEVLSQEDKQEFRSTESLSSAPINTEISEALVPERDIQEESVSSQDSGPVTRGYYTAFEVLSPQEDSQEFKSPETISSKDLLIVDNILPKEIQAEQSPESISFESPTPIEKDSFAVSVSSLEKENDENVDESQKLSSPITCQSNEPQEEIEEKLEINENVADEDIIEIQKIETKEAEAISDKQPKPPELIKNQTTSSLSEEVLPDVRPIPAARPKKKMSSGINEPVIQKTPEKLTLNPFDDDDDDDDDNAEDSKNPFAEDANNEIQEKRITSSQPDNQKTPPRPKKRIPALISTSELCWATPDHLQGVQHERHSINPFDDDDDSEPEVTFDEPKEEIRERKKIGLREEDKQKLARESFNPFDDDEDEEEIEASVRPVPVPTPRTTKANRPEPKPRDTLSVTSRGSHGGSSSSLSSNSAFGSARKKKPAPRPPVPFIYEPPGSSIGSASSSVAHSPNLSGTIRSHRKSKRAPLPPNMTAFSTPSHQVITELKERLDVLPTPLGISPINAESTEESRKEKNVKDEENRNRQSLFGTDQDCKLNDKSTIGRWKRRKGQAPPRPIPERRIVKSLPVSEIKRELDLIEIQQQGLEKQGVRLEEIIREKCEGTDREGVKNDEVPIEVEDLILQLFELVNEKNELFRRQAELMYLRRQQRLEEEYADVEYQIRCLLLQPESNKSDSDKVREEMLINRLVDIVERRNEIIECLEMDRKREAEEDSSISSQLNLYCAKRESDKDSPKEEKKEKKKKHKKLNKIIHTLKPKKEKDHKVDVDKDVDESEVPVEKEKKKKFHLFK